MVPAVLRLIEYEAQNLMKIVGMQIRLVQGGATAGAAVGTARSGGSKYRDLHGGIFLFPDSCDNDLLANIA